MARRSGRKADYSWATVCGRVTGIDLAIGTKVLGPQFFLVSEALTVSRLHGQVFA